MLHILKGGIYSLLQSILINEPGAQVHYLLSFPDSITQMEESIKFKNKKTINYEKAKRDVN